MPKWNTEPRTQTNLFVDRISDFFFEFWFFQRLPNEQIHLC